MYKFGGRLHGTSTILLRGESLIRRKQPLGLGRAASSPLLIFGIFTRSSSSIQETGHEKRCRFFSGNPEPLRQSLSFVAWAPKVRLQHSRCDLPGVRKPPGMEFTRQASTGLAKSLWGGCRREAFAALYHPFMVSLAAGTLPKASFQHYIAQDAFFLGTFMDAYQLAMENTDDEEAKAMIGALKQAVQEELAMHSSFAQSWGIDLTDPRYIASNSATEAYCDFLLATANGEEEEKKLVTHPDDSLRAGATSAAPGSTSARIIAAMTPCMRLYAFLGQEIGRYVKQVSDHPYQQWISTYSAADFEAAAFKIEQLLDKLTATLQGEDERAVLHRLYRQAMTLEVEFFSAQPLGPVQVPFFKCEAASEKRLVLVSDFDSTCTIADSCPVLADLTVENAGKIHSGRSIGEAEATALRKQWDALVMQYMDEYEEVLKQSLPTQEQGLGKAYIAGDLQTFLEQMSDFERKANARVEEAAVLKGLSLANIREAANSMPLREGCADFLKRLSAKEDPVDVHILSVCWSKTFIEGVLEKCEIRLPIIHANELSFDGMFSNGKLIRNVETALDKERHFVQLVEMLAASERAEKNREVRSVYVGDSLTDLLCLLRADVGIVLGDSGTLKQVYGRGLTPLYLKALHEEFANWKAGELRPSTGHVYTVSSWHEIEAFLMGPARLVGRTTK